MKFLSYLKLWIYLKFRILDKEPQLKKSRCPRLTKKIVYYREKGVLLFGKGASVIGERFYYRGNRCFVIGEEGTSNY